MQIHRAPAEPRAEPRGDGRQVDHPHAVDLPQRQFHGAAAADRLRHGLAAFERSGAGVSIRGGERVVFAREGGALAESVFFNRCSSWTTVSTQQNCIIAEGMMTGRKVWTTRLKSVIAQNALPPRTRPWI